MLMIFKYFLGKANFLIEPQYSWLEWYIAFNYLTIYMYYNIIVQIV